MSVFRGWRWPYLVLFIAAFLFAVVEVQLYRFPTPQRSPSLVGGVEVVAGLYGVMAFAWRRVVRTTYQAWPAARLSGAAASMNDLRALLGTLDPKARNHLRQVLIRDQSDRDDIASQLMRYRDERGDDWADIIDRLTMYPEARRRVVRLLGEIEAKGR